MRHGSNLDPPNRFKRVHSVEDLEQVEHDEEFMLGRKNRPIEYFDDASKSVVSENNSPDLPFRFSLNPYRGCIHSCSYCYARPSHEYLGFNAGLDFETKIVVKKNAASLFRDFLAKPSWKPESIMFSGVTDCYQPAEREFKLTRQCLQIALECRQPVSITTKNALILRDLDVLEALAADNLVHVAVSITTLDPALARDMEPRTSIPNARLRAIEGLTKAGVPVGVMMAPIIPGLNDSEIPQVLEAARIAGAQKANYVLLRLPLSVEPVFQEWLERTRPLKKDLVLGRVRQTREGKLNNSEFGERMVGTGEIADQISKMFTLFRSKFGMDKKLPPHNCELFEPPMPSSGQMRLF